MSWQPHPAPRVWERVLASLGVIWYLVFIGVLRNGAPVTRRSPENMTRRELANRITEFERGSRKREWIFFPFYIAGMVAIPVWIMSFSPDSTLMGILAMIGLFSWIIIPGVVQARINRKYIYELRLQCVECQAKLVGAVGKLAVTTTFCSQCGAKTVERELGEPRQ